MSSPDQFLLLLDVDASADQGGALQRVPHECRYGHVLRRTDFGYERRPGVTHDRLEDKLFELSTHIVNHARDLLLSWACS